MVAQAQTIKDQAEIIQKLQEQLKALTDKPTEGNEQDDNLNELLNEKDKIIKSLVQKRKKKQPEPEFIDDEPQPSKKASKKTSKKTSRKTKTKKNKVLSESKTLDLNMFEDL